MPYPNRDPKEIAAKYRVKKVEGEQFELYAAEESLSRISTRNSGAFLNFKAAPEAILWKASDTKNSFYTLEFFVTDLRIGNSGNEGWSSNLADDCLFVIDGEVLRHVPLTSIRIVTQSQFEIEREFIAIAKLESPPNDPTPNANHPFACATLTHYSTITKLGCSESLECTIGVPHEVFEKLLDGCLRKRILAACFHGIGSALSTSFQYGEARDLIIVANGGFDIKIDSVTIDYHCKPETPVLHAQQTKETPTNESRTENLPPTLHHVTAGIESLRSTIIKAAWIVAISFLVVTIIK